MGIFPILKGYFLEGSFVCLTFCYSSLSPQIWNEGNDRKLIPSLEI
jgi:hypothetical protein